MKYYKNFWRNYFNFTGFSNRTDIWVCTIINIILLFGLNIINTSIAGLFQLLILIPTFALYRRRLRDGGHSVIPLIVGVVIEFICAFLGIANKLFSWIPVLGWISTFLFVILPAIIAFIMGIYLFIILFCQGSKITISK